MKKFIQVILIASLLTPMVSKAAPTDGKLLTKINCAVVANNQNPTGLPIELAAFGGGNGLSCQDLRTVMKGFTAVKIMLKPIQAAMLVPGARDAIMAQMAAMGITVASPVILIVGGVTAGVGGVAYFLVQTSLEECQRMEQQDELKRKVLEELRQSYGIQSSPLTTLQIQSKP